MIIGSAIENNGSRIVFSFEVIIKNL